MPEVPALPGSPGLNPSPDTAVEPLAGAVARVFAPAGPLAAAVDLFEPRASQVEMAAAVSDAIERGTVLLAEAGTGTGKTLAYLIPAILSRQRVLVSMQQHTSVSRT